MQNVVCQTQQTPLANIQRDGFLQQLQTKVVQVTSSQQCKTLSGWPLL